MRCIKYLVAFFALFAIALCTGEFYQVYLLEIPNRDVVTFSLPEEASVERFYASLQEEAAACGVSAYRVDEASDENLIRTDVTVYCSDEKAKQYLREACLVEPGVYKSVFLSEANVRFAQLKDCRVAGKTVFISLLGDVCGEQALIDQMSVQYAVETQSTGNRGGGFYSSEAFLIQLALWGLACTIIAVMGLYEVMLARKETAVQYSLGERPVRLYLKKILLDSAVFLLLFAAVFRGLSQFTHSLFAFPVSMGMLGALLVVNALALTPLLRVDLRRAFSGVGGSHALLSASYAMKLLTCVLTVVVAAAGIGVAAEMLELKKQGDFFKKYRDYSYISMRPAVEDLTVRDESAVLLYHLQRECFREGNVVLQSTYTTFQNMGDGKSREGIVCNRNAKDNLLESIPGLKEEMLGEEKMYIILPSYPGQEKDLKKIMDFAQPALDGDAGYFFCHKYEIELISYDGPANLVALDDSNSGTGKICRDPIIYFSNLDESKLTIPYEKGKLLRSDGFASEWEGGLGYGPYCPYLMFRLTDAEISDFARRNGFSLTEDYYSKTNVYESFVQTDIRAEKVLILLGILFFFLFLLEVVLISTVIRMEYSVNAKELAVKRVLGYGVLQKNWRIFAATFSVIFLGLAAALTMSLLLELASPLAVIAGCVLPAAAESAVILWNIIKTEKAQLVKILKGGSL